MRLNLTAVADYMENTEILQRKLNSQNPFTLRYPVIYHQDAAFTSDKLYIASSNMLPKEPIIDSNCSIISIGYPPLSYICDNVELLCLSDGISPEYAFQEVQEIFDRFYQIENRMNEALLDDKPYHAIGRILFELFKNPMQAMTCFEKFLFVTYDPARPEFLKRYQQYEVSEYVPIEERLIIRSDPEFSGIYSVRGVFYCTSSVAMYGDPVLMYNLYDGDTNYGCIYIEEAYKPIAESDYLLLEWAGSFLIRLLKKNGSFTVSFPENVHNLVTQLAINRLPYREEYDLMLNKQGWNRNDPYLCICVLSRQDDINENILINGAVTLNSMIERQYIILEGQSIIQIINLRKTNLTETEIMQRLQLITAHSPLVLGISEQFNRFENVNIYYRQAMTTAKKISQNSHKSIGTFSQLLPEIMLDKIFQDEEPSFFLSHRIHKLIEYDTMKNSELVKTLKIFLQNRQNATHTQALLHISRATCIYRIRRIEEITGMNLNDFDTILYLQILFRYGIIDG